MAKGQPLLEEFINLCIKMKTTNFRQFFKATQRLSEILEAKGNYNTSLRAEEGESQRGDRTRY